VRKGYVPESHLCQPQTETSILVDDFEKNILLHALHVCSCQPLSIMNSFMASEVSRIVASDIGISSNYGFNVQKMNSGYKITTIMFFVNTSW
jgi:hypothetical protein